MSVTDLQTETSNPTADAKTYEIENTAKGDLLVVVRTAIAAHGVILQYQFFAAAGAYKMESGNGGR